jgi:putative phosphoribosyl transferase
MAANTVSSREVTLRAGDVALTATLSGPPAAGALVLFAHGTGSGRFSPRNRRVATSLHDAGLATLLLDLLTPDDQRADEACRQGLAIPLLAERLCAVVDGLGQRDPRNRPETLDPGGTPLPLGLFGASTGAAVALITAAARPDAIGAVVCRGGRPDLAAAALAAVRCPTLFIVGGADRAVLALNRQAASGLTAPHSLRIVKGASHLFAEFGALDAVAELAREWFAQHLLPASRRPSRSGFSPCPQPPCL